MFLIKLPRKRNIVVEHGTKDSIQNSERDGRIIKTIVELSHNIGLKVIAEGVETKEQADRLCDIECDMLQGYLIGKPANAGEIVKRLKPER